MIKAFKLRLYPTKSQAELLKQFAGNCRWLWNHLLQLNQERYKTEKKFIFHKEMRDELPQMKKEIEWLGIAPSGSLQRVAKNLDKALKDSFKKQKGFPKFKKKSDFKDSFYLANNVFKVLDDFIQIPKMEPIKFRTSKEYKENLKPENVGKILSATVSQDGDQWFISIAVEFEKSINTATLNNPVGIDLGVKEIAVTSDGKVFKNPRHLKKAEKRLRRHQRRLSKAKKGSNNRKKRQLKVYRLHRKVRNQRSDYLHKLTSSITKNYNVICVEDLNVSGMKRNRCLSKAISDAGMGEILRQLKYKADWLGKHLVSIDRFAPSSQICSCCGNRQKMPLNKRIYNCPSCGLSLDRDLNAAINIRNLGLEKVGQGLSEPTVNAVNA